jgi:hypothetical protein
MFFFMEITSIWQKSQDFWFADLFLEIFKTHRLVWIFLWVFCSFQSVSSKYIKKTNKEKSDEKYMNESEKGQQKSAPPQKKINP